MSEEFYTVEFAAERLKLHPKTVLKFIRDGRLRATKVGRHYRILRSDLAALVGDIRPARGPLREVRSTTIVDISNVDAEFARRMASLMTGARAANGRYAEPLVLSQTSGKVAETAMAGRTYAASAANC